MSIYYEKSPKSKYPNTKHVQRTLLDARKTCPVAMKILKEKFILNDDCPMRERLKAIQIVLDRGLGRPIRQDEITTDESLDNLTPQERVEVLKEALQEQEELAKGETN
jgi:hypothetical protein